MGKFDDVEVGDTVYASSDISWGWGEYRSFMMPQEITSVSPKRFKVGDKVFHKEDGNCVGGSYFNRAYNLGDEAALGSGKLIKDETKEYQSFREKIASIHEFRKRVKDLGSIALSPENESPETPEIKAALSLVTEAIEVFGKTP
jgi:hypothetical protein